MKITNQRYAAIVFGLGALISAAGCHKRVAATAAKPPAAAPVPPVPTVTLNVSPGQITRGQAATLTWSVTNASQLTLAPGAGTVGEQGSQQVTPDSSTTYTITAVGNGGRAEASARVTVSVPSASTASPDIGELFQAQVKDAFFNLNNADLRPAARDSLTKDAEFLRSYPQVRVSIEGHCDERSSTEYNLGLGERRADAAKTFLLALGIGADRITTTSWDKEKPFCTDHDETCWAQNRRAHFVMNR